MQNDSYDSLLATAQTATTKMSQDIISIAANADNISDPLVMIKLQKKQGEYQNLISFLSTMIARVRDTIKGILSNF